METSRIYQLSSSDNERLRGVESKLITNEVLSQEDIRSLARVIAEEVSLATGHSHTDAERRAAMLDMFNMQYLFRSFLLSIEHAWDITERTNEHLTLRDTQDGQEVIVTEQDIVDIVTPIRKAVFAELQKQYPDSGWYRVSEDEFTTTHGKDIVLLDNGFIAKEYSRKDADLSAKNVEAITMLHRLPEHSPFVAYTHKERDAHGRIEIMKKLNMSTVRERMYQDPPQPLQQTIIQFTDAIRGAQFLVDHGFVLSDLSSDNLGIDTATERGMLFDLDGLVREGQKTSYPCKELHFPPELIEQEEKDPDGRVTFHEEQMVYELGVSLKQIIVRYSRMLPFSKNDQIAIYVSIDLYRRMTDQHPERRPSLHTCLTKLDELLKRIA